MEKIIKRKDKEFEKAMDELDEQFDKWNKGVKEKDAKLNKTEKTSEIPLPKIENIQRKRNVIKKRKQRILKIRERQHQRAIKHVKSLRSPTKNARKIMLAIALLLPQPFIFYFIYQNYQSLMPQSFKFSLEIVDGITSEKLQPGNFTYRVFGTNNILDINDFHLLSCGNFDNFDEENLDGFDEYLMEWNGTIGNKIYCTRWNRIFPGQENIIYAFALPSSASMNIVYMNNLTSINSIGIKENITIMISSNISEQNSAFISSFNYRKEEWESACFKIFFLNNTGFSDFSIYRNQEKIPKERHDSRCIKYNLYNVSPEETIYRGEWNINGNMITRIQLTWNENILCEWSSIIT